MISNILVAIDTNDEQASKIVGIAANLARTHNAQLNVLAVYQHETVVVGSLGGAVAAVPLSPEEDTRLMQAVEARLREIISAAAPDAKLLVEGGAPALKINEAARSLEADLTVVGCHQKGFWQSLFDPSVSKTVLDDAPNAIFVVTDSSIDKLA